MTVHLSVGLGLVSFCQLFSTPPRPPKEKEKNTKTFAFCGKEEREVGRWERTNYEVKTVPMLLDDVNNISPFVSVEC